ncbi:hypothetical protein MHYP_G00226930 [Metynnis hypsauchen]
MQKSWTLFSLLCANLARSVTGVWRKSREVSGSQSAMSEAENTQQHLDADLLALLPERPTDRACPLQPPTAALPPPVPSQTPAGPAMLLCLSPYGTAQQGPADSPVQTCTPSASTVWPPTDATMF